MTGLRPVILSVGVLALVAGLVGYLLGQRQATLTETDVINAYAARYVAETGGQPTDCAAIPGPGDVWLVIRCGGEGLAGRVFEVDRQGNLIGASLGGPST